VWISKLSSPLAWFSKKRTLLLEASRPGFFPAASIVMIELDTSLTGLPFRVMFDGPRCPRHVSFTYDRDR
jgi:hypothetical protein